MSFLKNNLFSLLTIVFYLAVPIYLYSIPANTFNGDGFAACSVGGSGQFSACALKASVLNLMHLDLEMAKTFNEYILLIFPVLLAFWGYVVFSEGMALYKKIRVGNAS